jgi:hypothetical protein
MSNNMSVNSPVPQRTISLSIAGIDELAEVKYSYWSPVTGEHHADVPVCDLLVNRPINSLFTLDYQSSLNGWIITGTHPHTHSRTLPSTIGPNELSVSTFNTNEYSGDVFRFYIDYRNTITGAKISIDPQEGNVPGRIE